MKAFFVNQFKDYERESYDHELEEAKTKVQYEVKKQKKNLSKLLLGVGLTSKCLKTRDYMIFDEPEEQEYAQEVDKIKVSSLSKPVDYKDIEEYDSNTILPNS